MLVSWNWLKEYVQLDMPAETLADRLMMSGLNLESISDVGGDLCIDLEVTSNRPDCLGHLGIARETSVLYNRPLTIPNPQPATSATQTSSVASVTISAPDVCPVYIARVIRGVKIGPSPFWLTQRLKTVGLTPINNVVDITNYVLMECGQPLHAFDFAKLAGQRVEVRAARPGEKLAAINQKTYDLSPEMCVIADAERPVALAGVMGGLDSEISDTTTDVLIEVAEFAPRSIRSTARKLGLHSPSSYRFERGIDRTQLEWASRRCCELILQLAGGELLADPVVAGSLQPVPRAPITLRFSQIQRILGIDLPPAEVVRILCALGLLPVGSATAEAATFTPPSWRRDLEREIDLIEEAARIVGYEQIPENRPVALAVAAPTIRDQVRNRVADLLVGAGFFEAYTISFVDEPNFELHRPWGELKAVAVDHSTRRKENLLRQSLIPSLLVSRRDNERHGNYDARLFEMAKVYLNAEPDRAHAEPDMLTFVTEQPFLEAKGLLESLASSIHPANQVSVKASPLPLFETGRGAEVLLNGQPWGWLGEVAGGVRDQLELRDSVTVAEVRLAGLWDHTLLSPTYQEVARFPASERDLNFVLDEQIPWSELSDVVRHAAGPHLEAIRFGGQYRGQQIAAQKKSYVVRLSYRGSERTLTNEEVETAQQRVIAACTSQLGAALR